MKSDTAKVEKVDETWNLESALDALIVLLYAKGSKGHVGEQIEGVTRLDKLLYLLSESPEFDQIVNKGYSFDADNFGPFAPEIYDDIAALKQEGIIEGVSPRKPKNKIETVDEETVEQELDVEEEVIWKNYPNESYRLTNRGLQIGSLLYKSLTAEQKVKVEKIKKVFGNMKLKNLLHYVYSKYPEMTKRSKIREKILY